MEPSHSWHTILDCRLTTPPTICRIPPRETEILHDLHRAHRQADETSLHIRVSQRARAPGDGRRVNPERQPLKHQNSRMISVFTFTQALGFSEIGSTSS